MTTTPPSSAISLVIDPRPHDLGEFEVRRVLPHAARQTVGPFIFFDHMGPVEFGPGKGVSVRPHPHIGLATVTYLFDGAIIHRDSLGVVQSIEPGDVNWMVAGRGIVHSERTSDDDLARPVSMEGIQSWVALPLADEDAAPSFRHHPADTLPEIRRAGVVYRLIAGNAFGARAPARVYSPMFCVHAEASAGSALELPSGYAERALYLVSGQLAVDGENVEAGRMLIFEDGAAPAIEARSAARVMLLGGAPLDGERVIWWNFVASSQERIDEAKARWRNGGFESVPGDDEFIPLPEK